MEKKMVVVRVDLKRVLLLEEKRERRGWKKKEGGDVGRRVRL
jgi:hypothetical protein